MAIPVSNLTSGFIDLATYDDIESEIYGYPNRMITQINGQNVETLLGQRSTYQGEWISQVPTILNRAKGSANWGENYSVYICGGDALLQTWVDIDIGNFMISENNRFGVDGRLFWTKNLAHNLFSEICVMANERVIERVDNYVLDFLSHYNIPKSKKQKYYHHIGNTLELITPQVSFDDTVLCLPIPFFYSKDYDSAYLTCRVADQENTISFSCRDWRELITLVNIQTGEKLPVIEEDLDSVPTLSMRVNSNYAVYNRDKRQNIVVPDKVIEQFWTMPTQNINFHSNPTPSYDVRFEGPVFRLMFGVRNITNCNEWSIYEDDMVKRVSLIYEETMRLSQMPVHYFDFIQPFYHGDSVPKSNGMYMYSYGVDKTNSPSTNYGKLTNVSICPEITAKQGDFRFIIIGCGKTVMNSKILMP
jgi:hypothetical protein